jgi:hypothetical protein
MIRRIARRIIEIISQEFTWYKRRCELKNSVARMAR